MGILVTASSNPAKRGPEGQKQKKNPWPNGRARRPPGPSLGRGAGTTTRGHATCDDGSAAPSSWCEKSRKTQQKGKTKTTERNDQNTLAASRPEKGPQKGRASSSPVSSRRIPKTRGAQNGTPKKRQEAGRTAKKGEQTNAAGQKKEQEKATKVRVGVCPVTT